MKYDFLNNLNLEYVSCNEYTYKDVNNEIQTELILFYDILDKSAESKITIFSNPFFLYAYKNTLKIRIPLLYDELKKYYSNYKDYYYLPLEDMCILKSIGGSVDSNYRENAKKETCYIKYRGFFIPNIYPNTPGFKKSFDSKITYTEYVPDQIDINYLKEYAMELVEYLNS